MRSSIAHRAIVRAGQRTANDGVTVPQRRRNQQKRERDRRERCGDRIHMRSLAASVLTAFALIPGKIMRGCAGQGNR